MMIAPSARLAGARYVNPLRQGDLSNLCGLYSVLNAVQLACWRVPPSSDQLRRLLTFGFRYLTKRRLLASVVALGLRQEDWAELSGAIIAFANELLATSLVIQPITAEPGELLCPSSIIMLLKRAVAQGHPVLCGFGGALGHYTVLAGYSERRLTLFDSSGLRWIEQRSIGLSEQCRKLHWLYADSATAIVDVW